MHVFITGASGHIGSALVPELQRAGHQVIGLAGSDESAAKLTAAGAEVRRGGLDDVDIIAKEAADADGVSSLAYRSDLMQAGDGAGVIAVNLKVIEAVGGALEGTGKPFVTPVGTLVPWSGGITGRAGTEDDIVQGGPLAETENAAAALAQRGRPRLGGPPGARGALSPGHQGLHARPLLRLARENSDLGREPRIRFEGKLS
jgi:nucleoside-diphosphate-sugar epimerase